MVEVKYRVAGLADAPAMARIRAVHSGSEEGWKTRIEGYLKCEHHPQKALLPRVAYVAEAGDSVMGFIAGHLTRRYGCDGELEWVDVVAAHRGQGIAGELVRLLAKWFVAQKAKRICVDPGNNRARQFYEKHGAEKLNQHWLVWNDIQRVLND
jgi:GNAT superfamily N-acetyltransferase